MNFKRSSVKAFEALYGKKKARRWIGFSEGDANKCGFLRDFYRCWENRSTYSLLRKSASSCCADFFDLLVVNPRSINLE